MPALMCTDVGAYLSWNWRTGTRTYLQTFINYVLPGQNLFSARPTHWSFCDVDPRSVVFEICWRCLPPLHCTETILVSSEPHSRLLRLYQDIMRMPSCGQYKVDGLLQRWIVLNGSISADQGNLHNHKSQKPGLQDIWYIVQARGMDDDNLLCHMIIPLHMSPVN